MKIYRFDSKTAKKIQNFGSQKAALIPIAPEIKDAHISMLYIEPGGVVGYHAAASDQLFLVVQGSGWVTGEDRERVAIRSGMAAYWRRDEGHESGSAAGMVVIVIEAERIEPALPKMDN